MGVISVERCYSEETKGRYESDECGEMLLMGNERQGLVCCRMESECVCWRGLD